MNLSRYTAVLWRGPGRAQVGGDRSHHVLLDNLHARDQLWLANHTNVGQRPASTTPSPELLAALSGSGLLDHTDRRPRLSVDVLGAVPATLLALRSLVDSLSFALRVDGTLLVDEDWDRVFGGTNTGTPRARAVRRELSDLICPSQLHYQGATDLAIVSGDRAIDPAIPFDLTVRDIPHLLVVRGEHSYEIGPFVIPGHTPCYQCEERARAENDPFHLTNLRELIRWPLGPLSLLAHFAAAACVAGLVRDFASGALSVEACSRVTTIDEEGHTTVERVAPSRECACGIDTLAL